MLRAAHEGRESELVAYTSPVLAADHSINELWGNAPRMFTILELIGSLVVAVPADYTRYL